MCEKEKPSGRFSAATFVDQLWSRHFICGKTYFISKTDIWPFTEVATSGIDSLSYSEVQVVT